jgi:ornithine cyclodeaminase/alanine dehydrogenase-like protein (mu-crystallin family)
MIHLDDPTIESLLDLQAVTNVVGAAFAAWGRGEAATTQRLRAATADAMASAMAAVVPPFSGGKVYATKNGKFTFLNVLFDVHGRLLCTLDGDALTAFRTPAACALAIRALSVPESGDQPITTGALIGAGRQGWYHLEMLHAELPNVREIRIADMNPDAVNYMVTRARAAGIPAVAARDAPSAADGADVIMTVTQSTTPLFPASVVADRALICAVGATKYDRCEIGADVIARCASVVCDDVIGSRAECGDLIQAHAAGKFEWDRAVELHAVLAGTVTPARAGAAPALFETQGVALQDVAAAGLAWQRAIASGTIPDPDHIQRETTP